MILPIIGKVGDFVDGEVVTGQTSGAKGIVATHFLRCQDLVNPSNVATPVKFKAVFELGDLPPASKGIALTGVEGIFQDGETVLGATSEATAEVDEWTTQTFDLIALDKNGLTKVGYACDKNGENCSDAWPRYYAFSPVAISFLYTVLRSKREYPSQCGGIPNWGYVVDGVKSFLSFNTIAAKVGATSAKIIFTADVTLEGGVANPSLNLYVQDFGEEIDSTDWDNGALLATESLSEGAGQSIEIPFSPSSVSIGGTSKYKINLKEIDDGEEPCPTNSIKKWEVHMSSIQLVLTRSV